MSEPEKIDAKKELDHIRDNIQKKIRQATRQTIQKWIKARFQSISFEKEGQFTLKNLGKENLEELTKQLIDC